MLQLTLILKNLIPRGDSVRGSGKLCPFALETVQQPVSLAFLVCTGVKAFLFICKIRRLASLILSSEL